MQELAKELSGFKTLPVDEIRTSHKKPQYTSEGSSIGYGSVLIENIKVYDRLSHTEMADIIEMMSNAKKILYNPGSVRQTKEGELQKRKLLSLLGQLNWGVKDYTLQARLLKPMEDRLNSSIFLQKLNVTHEWVVYAIWLLYITTTRNKINKHSMHDQIKFLSRLFYIMIKILLHTV